MKSFLFAAAALFSVNAYSINTYACPDLGGQYECTADDGSTEIVTVSMRVEDGVTIYDFDGEGIPADNKRHDFEETSNDGMTIKGYTLAKCSGNALRSKADMTMYFGDMAFAQIGIDAEYTRVATGLRIKGQSQVTDNSTGRTETENIDETCDTL